MRAAIAIAIRVIAAAKGNYAPAPEDALAMAKALAAAAEDEERRSSDHHLGLIGAWRGEVVQARRLEVCQELAPAAGEDAQA